MRRLVHDASAARTPGGSRQLELPFAREPHVVALGGEGRLDVQLTRWGMRLELALPVTADVPASWWDEDLDDPYEVEPPDTPLAPPPERQAWSATVRVTPRARADIPRVGGGAFLLVSGLGKSRRAAADGTLSVLRLISDSQFAHAGRLCPDSLRAAARLLAAGSAHLPALCSPAALRASRGFPGHRMMHWFVYESVANDSTGRVAQMVDVCPGLLIMARGLHDLAGEDPCLAILAAIRRGRKLGRVLDLAVDLWSQHISAPGHPFERLPAAAEVAMQRQRIRRAGKLVNPGSLASPFAPGLAVEDIPTEPTQNARWFEVTSHVYLWALPAVEADGRAREGQRLGGFVSRHWRALDTHAKRNRSGLDTVLRELFDFMRHARRVPNRSTDPARLLRECHHWHENAFWEQYAGLPPGTVLDTAGLAGWTGHGSTITVLQTVGALIQESRTMRHCIAAYARRAAAGSVQISHASLRGKPLTVMTRRTGGGLHIIEAAGPCNRPPTPEEKELLALWIAEVGRQ